MSTNRRPLSAAAHACTAALLLAALAAAPAAVAKKAKAGEMAAELCNREGVKLGKRNLTVEVDFADGKVEKRVREHGTLCFEYAGASYEVTPSLSKDRMGFVDLEVRRLALDGERRIDLHFHVHSEEFLDQANSWPELVRFEIVRVVPPLNRSMVGPETDSGSVIKH